MSKTDLFDLGYQQAFSGYPRHAQLQHNGEYDSGYEQGLFDRQVYEDYCNDSIDHYIEEEYHPRTFAA